MDWLKQHVVTIVSVMVSVAMMFTVFVQNNKSYAVELENRVTVIEKNVESIDNRLKDYEADKKHHAAAMLELSSNVSESVTKTSVNHILLKALTANVMELTESAKAMHQINSNVAVLTSQMKEVHRQVHKE